MNTGPISGTYDTKQAADYLGVKPSSLRTWRSTKAVRIPYIKIGGCVRYRRADLNEFLHKNMEA